MPNTKAPKDRVGYKNPPAQHRFKKGQSGNPAGRPRKAKTKFGAHPMESWLQEAWLSEGAKVVTVSINGRPVRTTMGQLAIQRAFADAAAGKPTAMRIVAQKLTEAERLRRERHIEDIETAGLLRRRAATELEGRLAAGEADPLVFPHPDDFVFNKETELVDIVGPTNMEEHQAAMLLVTSCLELVTAVNNDIFKHPDDRGRALIINRLGELNSLLPPRLRQWPQPKFEDDYSLFPHECVKHWVLNGFAASDSS